MVVIVFRSKLHADLTPDIGVEAQRYGARMVELAQAMPGFVSYKDFAASDGEQLSLVEFDSHEHAAAWRDHPEHRQVQEWGRQRLFREYRIQVCDLVRGSHFPR